MYSTTAGPGKWTAVAHLRQKCPRFSDLAQNRTTSQENDVVRGCDETIIREIWAVMPFYYLKAMIAFWNAKPIIYKN